MAQASQGRGLQAVILASLVAGGYWLLRGRHRNDPLSEGFDFDRAPTTRHMVGMARRVDKEKLASFLQAEAVAEEQASGAGRERER
jgi:hypothetical protein